MDEITLLCKLCSSRLDPQLKLEGAPDSGWCARCREYRSGRPLKCGEGRSRSALKRERIMGDEVEHCGQESTPIYEMGTRDIIGYYCPVCEEKRYRGK